LPHFSGSPSPGTKNSVFLSSSNHQHPPALGSLHIASLCFRFSAGNSPRSSISIQLRCRHSPPPQDPSPCPEATCFFSSPAMNPRLAGLILGLINPTQASAAELSAPPPPSGQSVSIFLEFPAFSTPVRSVRGPSVLSRWA